jgi:hypothetical protein
MLAKSPRPKLTSALLVAGALAVCSCGSNQAAHSSKETSSESASAKTAPRPLTTAQLKSLAFQEGEVPQAYKDEPSTQVPEPESEQDSSPPISNPACQRMFDSTNGEAASAVVLQVFNWKGDIYPGGSTLAAYENTGAQRAFTQVRKGLKTCKSFSGVGYTGKYRAEITTEKSLDVGDEAVRFRMSTPATAPPAKKGQPDRKVPRVVRYTVVRVGAVIATFDTMKVGEKPTSFPSALIAKQVERLRNAQRH